MTSSTISQVKYVLVSGGVISGIGKGLTASSLGVLLKSCGWRVTAIKIDPYINVDAGTMSPFEHGEVFVLDDGGEVDLDLGNYERFLDMKLNCDNNITTGKIYEKVIRRERRGDFLGKTVQVVPHVTDEIISWIERVGGMKDADGRRSEICVIELGGVIGDIESMPFVEALRQLRYKVGDDNFCSVFVSLVPELGVVGEQKTKPTQHGVKDLRSMGLSPQLIVCRSERPLDRETQNKLGMFCQVPPEAVVSVHDVSNTYKIPLMLQEQGVCNLMIKCLKLVWRLPLRLEKWGKMALTADQSSAPEVKVAIVGKYTNLCDSYLSVVRALQHAGMAIGRKIKISWVESTSLEVVKGCSDCESLKFPCGLASCTTHDGMGVLETCDGVLVPGGFGDRGVEGKINAIEYAHTNNIPFFGICLGMQLAVVCLTRISIDASANSEEFDAECSLKAVIFMPEGSKVMKGGTMRLGARATRFRDGCEKSDIYQLYKLHGYKCGARMISERHRHRYEVNPELIDEIVENTGLDFIGTDESGKRMEIFELRDHPYFVGTQFHPEFNSRPGRPSPPFLGFVLKAAKSAEPVGEVLKKIREQNPWADFDSDSEADVEEEEVEGNGAERDARGNGGERSENGGNNEAKMNGKKKVQMNGKPSMREVRLLKNPVL